MACFSIILTLVFLVFFFFIGFLRTTMEISFTTFCVILGFFDSRYM